jgi:hypothetical protein
MRCNCERCRGDGEIVCPECNGRGHYEGALERMVLERGVENYDELLALQNDAKRVIRQADTLTKLRPDRASSYAAQLDAALETINREADNLERKTGATTSVLNGSQF